MRQGRMGGVVPTEPAPLVAGLGQSVVRAKLCLGYDSIEQERPELQGGIVSGPKHEALATFPVVIDVPVAWGEMDAFQHVNNIVYFRYFENARIAYLAELDYLCEMEQRGIGPILAATNCTFKFPLAYPDTVWVGAKVIAIGDDRFTVRHLAVSQRHQRVAAEGEAVIVTFDYRGKCKMALPTTLRQRIEEIERSTGTS
jgi:acyl-CoA thioester hydrolase